MKPLWERDTDSGGYIARVGNVTLAATPDRTKRHGMGCRAARGTKWRAQCSIWDGVSTVSGYGRDAYRELVATSMEARALAERIYAEAIAKAT